MRLELPTKLPRALLSEKLAYLCKHRNEVEPALLNELREDLTLRAAPEATVTPTPDPGAERPRFSQEELDTCIKVLEALKSTRGRGAPPQALERVYRLAGALWRTGRTRRNEARARLREVRRAEDQALLAQTGIRRQRAGAPALVAKTEGSRALSRARRCYICKRPYFEVHLFYDSLCAECGALNQQKRHQRGALQGAVALVTGGRIKIGFEIVKMLLESGARVVITTRFPKDAAQRFETVEGAAGRLQIFGLDLRYLPRVEAFADHIAQRFDRLDILINNAAQTIYRPPSFYRALAQRAAALELGPGARAMLAPAPASPLFPVHSDDGHGQPLDLRSQNSWRLRLSEVQTPELVEVHLVNAMAPFILNSRLRPLMVQTQAPAKFIVNVSAMEGQFDRYYKSRFHPHTNMAKAALNMMTRTSAQDYARDRIYMTSVDTGWVTNENPYPIAEHMAHTGFSPPLDEVDGAARVLDPIFEGLSSGAPAYGVFFKDYRPTRW